MNLQYRQISKQLDVVSEGKSGTKGAPGPTATPAPAPRMAPSNSYKWGHQAFERAKHGGWAKGAALGAGIGALLSAGGNMLKSDNDPTKKGLIRSMISGASTGGLVGGAAGWAAKKIANSDYLGDVQSGLAQRALTHNAMHGGPRMGYLNYVDANGVAHRTFVPLGKETNAQVRAIRDGGGRINSFHTINYNSKNGTADNEFIKWDTP